MKPFVYHILFIVLAYSSLFSQNEKEVAPPYNIKTISFLQKNNNIVPIIQLGTPFQLQFDDLFGNEADYYYEIIHCDYDWIPTDIPKNEYLQGYDNQRIMDYTNSLNTLQLYSHYRLTIPNQFTTLRISGNYILKILNHDKEVVFSRKFILYENLVTVPVQIRRARTANNLNSKQNIDFSIRSLTITFQDPLKRVKTRIVQNGELENGIKNIQPQYTIGNELIYKYDAETQFWAGNEFLFFENKFIRNNGNNIAKVDLNGALYSSYLFPHTARANYPYSFTQDINGGFVVTNANTENNEIEADYTWVHFTLSAPAFMSNKNIYINGLFNNYSLSEEFKMDYNSKKGIYEKALLIKQGFTNYKYQIADSKGKLDPENAIDGNFVVTENDYTVLVYYRENSQRYDRVIGIGTGNSIILTN